MRKEFRGAARASIDAFYRSKADPHKSCFLILKELILETDERISEDWKYGMPFFCIEGKMFCYLWSNKKSGEPYIGIVDGNKIDHPKLIKGKRERMKILPIDPFEDLPVDEIRDVLFLALKYRR